MKEFKEVLVERYEILERDQNKLPPSVLCRMRYPVCNIGERNANKRVYGREVWEKTLARPDIQEKLDKRCLFGEAEHPDEPQTRLERTSHVIHGFYMDGNKVYQDIDVLDTPYGRIIHTLVEANCGVGVSTRAEGDLEESEDEQGKFHRVIPETYHYITTDFTADPSTKNPYPIDVQMALAESIQKYKDGLDSGFVKGLLERMEEDKAKSLLENVVSSIKEADEDEEDIPEEDVNLDKDDTDVDVEDSSPAPAEEEPSDVPGPDVGDALPPSIEEPVPVVRGDPMISIE